MNKLLIILVIVILTFTVKADDVEAMIAYTKDRCGTDDACATAQSTAINCVHECGSKAENEQKTCISGCTNPLSDSQKLNYLACALKLSLTSSSVLSLSLLIIFGFFLMI